MPTVQGTICLCSFLNISEAVLSPTSMLLVSLFSYVHSYFSQSLGVIFLTSLVFFLTRKGGGKELTKGEGEIQQ